MLTKERAELLTNYLTEDEERGQRLITLTADEAVAEISKDGFDFTVDELHAYGEVIVALNKHESGELSEEQLEDVAGGVAWAAIGIWGLKVVGAWLIKKGLDYVWDKIQKR
jgi:lactobin A/cerein 7B family class IIb bacteriocin